MLIKKEDLIEIINQDAAYAIAKFRAFYKACPQIAKQVLDACDDKLADWLGKKRL
jgi:hypothetical protein